MIGRSITSEIAYKSRQSRTGMRRRILSGRAEGLLAAVRRFEQNPFVLGLIALTEGL